MAPTRQTQRPLGMKLSKSRTAAGDIDGRTLQVSQSVEGYTGKRRHRCIIVGPLYAVEVCPPSTHLPGVIDIVVTGNRNHWRAWTRGTKFDIEGFLADTSREITDNLPFDTNTKTSDYVSKLDVQRIVVAVNTRWNWNTAEDALTMVSIPIVDDQWTRVTFPFTKEHDIDFPSGPVYERRTAFWE